MTDRSPDQQEDRYTLIWRWVDAFKKQLSDLFNFLFIATIFMLHSEHESGENRSAILEPFKLEREMILEFSDTVDVAAVEVWPGIERIDQIRFLDIVSKQQLTDS